MPTSMRVSFKVLVLKDGQCVTGNLRFNGESGFWPAFLLASFKSCLCFERGSVFWQIEFLGGHNELFAVTSAEADRRSDEPAG
jgi:hypothetical protein